MTFYPSNASKKVDYRDLTVVDRIAKSKASGDTGTVVTSTLNNKYIEPLRGIFDWAITVGRIETNPFAGIRAKAARKDRRKPRRRSFTVPELREFFRSPVFTGSAASRYQRLYKPGKHRVDDWRYWLPLIALFSGARLNEICGLYLSDFDVLDGVDHFHIQETQEDQSNKSLAANQPFRCTPNLSAWD